MRYFRSGKTSMVWGFAKSVPHGHGDDPCRVVVAHGGVFLGEREVEGVLGEIHVVVNREEYLKLSNEYTVSEYW